MSLTALLTNLTPSDPNFLDQYTVFSDNDILILNKPAGLLSIPGKGQALADSVISRLQNICSNILLVHRLDRDTSGLMVFAFNKAAQRHLSTQFQQRQVEKAYTALVMGHIAPAIAERGQINLPVRYDETRPPLHVVDIDYPKPALTYFDVIDYSSLPDKDHVQHPVTRVNLKPVTGRAHQLRTHAGYWTCNCGRYTICERSGSVFSYTTMLTCHTSCVSTSSTRSDSRI